MATNQGDEEFNVSNDETSTEEAPNANIHQLDATGTSEVKLDESLEAELAKVADMLDDSTEPEEVPTGENTENTADATNASTDDDHSNTPNLGTPTSDAMSQPEPIEEIIEKEVNKVILGGGDDDDDINNDNESATITVEKTVTPGIEADDDEKLIDNDDKEPTEIVDTAEGEEVIYLDMSNSSNPKTCFGNADVFYVVGGSPTAKIELDEAIKCVEVSDSDSDSVLPSADNEVSDKAAVPVIPSLPKNESPASSTSSIHRIPDLPTTNSDLDDKKKAVPIIPDLPRSEDPQFSQRGGPQTAMTALRSSMSPRESLQYSVGVDVPGVDVAADGAQRNEDEAAAAAWQRQMAAMRADMNARYARQLEEMRSMCNRDIESLRRDVTELRRSQISSFSTNGAVTAPNVSKQRASSKEAAAPPLRSSYFSGSARRTPSPPAYRVGRRLSPSPSKEPLPNTHYGQAVNDLRRREHRSDAAAPATAYHLQSTSPTHQSRAQMTPNRGNSTAQPIGDGIVGSSLGAPSSSAAARALMPDFGRENQALLVRVDYLDKAYNSAMARVNEAEAEIEKLTNPEQLNLKNTLIVYQTKVSQLTLQLSDADAESSSLRAELEVVRADVRAKEAQLEAAEASRDRADDELRDTTRLLELKERTIEEDDVTVQRLMRDYDELAREHDSLKVKLNVAETHLHESKTEVSSMRRQVNQVQFDLRRLESENDLLTKRLQLSSSIHFGHDSPPPPPSQVITPSVPSRSCYAFVTPASHAAGTSSAVTAAGDGARSTRRSRSSRHEDVPAHGILPDEVLGCSPFKSTTARVAHTAYSYNNGASNDVAHNISDYGKTTNGDKYSTQYLGVGNTNASAGALDTSNDSSSHANTNKLYPLPKTSSTNGITASHTMKDSDDDMRNDHQHRSRSSSPTKKCCFTQSVTSHSNNNNARSSYMAMTNSGAEMAPLMRAAHQRQSVRAMATTTYDAVSPPQQRRHQQKMSAVEEFRLLKERQNTLDAEETTRRHHSPPEKLVEPTPTYLKPTFSTVLKQQQQQPPPQSPQTPKKNLSVATTTVTACPPSQRTSTGIISSSHMGAGGGVGASQRMNELLAVEKEFDGLLYEKRRLEANLSRLPTGPAPQHVRKEKIKLESRLEDVEKRLGNVRTTLKRFNLIKSSIH